MCWVVTEVAAKPEITKVMIDFVPALGMEGVAVSLRTRWSGSSVSTVCVNLFAAPSKDKPEISKADIDWYIKDSKLFI